MRLVTDGKEFALEKGRFFKKYASLCTYGIWRDLDDSFHTCWGTEKDVMLAYEALKSRKITIVQDLE